MLRNVTLKGHRLTRINVWLKAVPTKEGADGTLTGRIDKHSGNVKSKFLWVTLRD